VIQLYLWLGASFLCLYLSSVISCCMYSCISNAAPIETF